MTHKDRNALKNARIVLETSCRAATGETVLIIADKKLKPVAVTLADAAVDLGLLPMIADITHFLASPSYGDGRYLGHLQEAMKAADIVIFNTRDVHDPNRSDYSRLMGDADLHDSRLSADRRWVYLQCDGMGKWNIESDQVARMIRATKAIAKLVKLGSSGRVTSPGGTDLTFGLGKASSSVPVLGIVPLYAEVAVVPDPNGTDGVFVVDGPTQLDVRPNDETDRRPLIIEVRHGRMTAVEGDPTQMKRLKRFIASGDPAADAVDEVGIVTTPFLDNDTFYWSDGTHHHDRAHVALGNNVRRDAVIHGPRHMDGEIQSPTIYIDGTIVVRDGAVVYNVLDLV